jgi:hypothetical protein
MAIRKECPECHTLIDVDLRVCPECGYDEDCPCCYLHLKREEAS